MNRPRVTKKGDCTPQRASHATRKHHPTTRDVVGSRDVVVPDVNAMDLTLFIDIGVLLPGRNALKCRALLPPALITAKRSALTSHDK